VTLVLVFVGALVGAPLRYLTDRIVQRWHDTLLPWGTISVNVVGSFILGSVTGAPLPAAVIALVGTGFCGALTTYSTFSYETLRLIEQKAYFYAVAAVAVTMIAGLGAAMIGYTTVHAIAG
jgi:CrcB protein